MLYFIPAWYKENTWFENEQYWYRRRMRSEFDETIKQIQLFHRSIRTDYRILLLNYAPNLRHFLHRQGLYRAPYWSCFDSIQQVRRKQIAVLSFHNLKWPKYTEFIYSPFAIVAYNLGHKYAQIEFGEDGNLVSVDMFEKDQICRRNIYDDRGFLSSTIIFKEGKEEYQDFLNEEGKWKIRLIYSDGRVEVNSANPFYSFEFEGQEKIFEFKQSVYDSFEKLLQEVFFSYVNLTSGYDTFFAAVHPQHMELLYNTIKTKNIIATFFENRFDYNELPSIVRFLVRSNFIITDSKSGASTVMGVVDKPFNHIRDISPYDARMDFGISNTLPVQNILIPVDGLSDHVFESIIVEVSKYLKTNEKARVHLFTRNGSYNAGSQLLNKTADILVKHGFDRRWVFEEAPETEGENPIDQDEVEQIEIRFFTDCCIDESSISKCINEQRVILDFRATTDIYLFITALSKGVPRISIQKDQYFTHLKNGYLIHNFKEIVPTLSYYLDSMENWNQALVECYEAGKEFSTGLLIDAWREVVSIDE